MICKYCHTENKDEAEFCIECGKKLGDAVASQSMASSNDSDAAPTAKSKNNGLNPFMIIILLAAIGIGAYLYFSSNPFTDKEIEFLHSIGIEDTEVDEKRDDGSYVLKGNREFGYGKIIVKEKPGFQTIDEVRYRSSEKLYWNEELGKVGMNEADSDKYIKEFKNKHSFKKDDKKDCTYIDKVQSWDFGAKEMMMTGMYPGRGDSMSLAKLYAAFHYSGRDWIFFNRIRFNNGKDSWVYMLDGKMPDHDVVWGGVHEIIHIPVGDIAKGLRILTTGENPKVYLLGDNGDCGIEITPEQVENIKEYLQLYYITEL